MFVMINLFLKVRYLPIFSRFDRSRLIFHEIFSLLKKYPRRDKNNCYIERRSFPLNKDTNNNFNVACKFEIFREKIRVPLAV